MVKTRERDQSVVVFSSSRGPIGPPMPMSTMMMMMSSRLRRTGRREGGVGIARASSRVAPDKMAGSGVLPPFGSAADDDSEAAADLVGFGSAINAGKQASQTQQTPQLRSLPHHLTFHNATTTTSTTTAVAAAT